MDVHQRILEGQKERVQVFSGVVISRTGDGMREMFTVRRIVQGEGVERQFPLHSPKIAKIEVKRTGVRPPGQAVLPARPRRQGDAAARAQGQGEPAANGAAAKADGAAKTEGSRPKQARACA